MQGQPSFRQRDQAFEILRWPLLVHLLKDAMANLLKMLGKCLQKSGVNFLQFALSEEQIALQNDRPGGRDKTAT
jgi:hypothetical protein